MDEPIEVVERAVEGGFLDEVLLAYIPIIKAQRSKADTPEFRALQEAIAGLFATLDVVGFPVLPHDEKKPGDLSLSEARLLDLVIARFTALGAYGR